MGNVGLNSVQGTTVNVITFGGSISSSGASPLEASAQLNLSAATGITVFTLTPSLTATNTTSGDVSITQIASPSQDLAIVGTGVANSSSGGAVTITNLGGAR